RRTWRNGFVTDAHGSHSARRSTAVDLIAITDQVARSLIPRECLRALLGNPFRGRMRCDIDPNKVSACQSNDDEGIERVEANGRNNEQVHGGDFPVHGYAGRCASPGTAVHTASPCT